MPAQIVVQAIPAQADVGLHIFAVQAQGFVGIIQVVVIRPYPIELAVAYQRIVDGADGQSFKSLPFRAVGADVGRNRYALIHSFLFRRKGRVLLPKK